jgi:hypothetical protein
MLQTRCQDADADAGVDAKSQRKAKSHVFVCSVRRVKLPTRNLTPLRSVLAKVLVMS